MQAVITTAATRAAPRPSPAPLFRPRTCSLPSARRMPADRLRLDREATPRRYPPVVVRFEVIHVRAVTMHFLPDRMPGAVREVIAIAAALDKFARRIVYLEPAQILPRLHGFRDARNRRVARAGDYREDVAHLAGGTIAAEGGPGDVVVSRPWQV